MQHHALPEFWECYNELPEETRELADKCYAILVADSAHPSLRFKQVRTLWSVRVGLHYRALARRRGDVLHWFWIGHHSEYDKFLG
jgi:hypothetical protein